MTQDERLDCMLRYLLDERDETRGLALPADPGEKRRLWRSLVNVRPPELIDGAYLRTEDAYLQEELRRKGVTRLDGLTPVQPGLYLWQGDITTLAADAIVNAANSRMLGCFVPCHGCIDNAIHTYAGVQLRLECANIMRRQGHEEETGHAKITKGYNLPCRYVLHTVGPIIYGAVTPRDRAFCCISTGEFHFPGELAAQIAIQTVRAWQRQNPDRIEVIFNVFKDSDYEIYRRLLR